jgi:hypothetical protein
MANEPKYEFSRIKSLFFELPGFKWEHSQGGKDEAAKTCKPFVGRDDLVKKIADYIKAPGGGAYLVTGFRGVGKSTVVSKAIDDAKKQSTGSNNDSSKITDITISLAQEKLTGIDVLKIIAKKIYDTQKDEIKIDFLDQILGIITLLLMLGTPIILFLIGIQPIYLILNGESNKLVQAILATSFPIFLLSILFLANNLNQKNNYAKMYLGLAYVSLMIFVTIYFYVNVSKTAFSKNGNTLPWIFALTTLTVTLLLSRKVIEVLANFIDKNFPTKEPKKALFKIFDYLEEGNFNQKVVVFLVGASIILFLKNKILPEGKVPSIKLLLEQLGDQLGVQQFLSGGYSSLSFSDILIWVSSALIVFYAITKLRFSKLYYGTKNKHLSNFFDVYERLHLSEVSSENGQSFKIKDFFDISRKNVKKKGPVDFRELEDTLISFLSSNENKDYFVFVFDELDKLNFAASNTETTLGFEVNYAEKARQRQKVLADVLLNLKHFLNNAKAKFIFIAGRELYDADLADVADRDFFWGSIFNDVIYVESLLKSVHQNREKVEQLNFSDSAPTFFIEQFLCLYLLAHLKNETDTSGENTDEESDIDTKFKYLVYGKDPNLKLYADELIKFKGNIIDLKSKKINNSASLKALLFLNDFVIYLTYRSGGLPMKLNKVFEEYIVKAKRINNTDFDHREFIYLTNNAPAEDGYFLHFSYDQQYEIGFIANLYRPFLTKNASFLSFLDDKVLESIPFLIDHLLKLHEFGFASRNLEQIPELMEPNRAPSLRQFIASLISYLSIKHIRRVDNGLFSYRFYRNVSNEISFLSKLSAQASAAFNFTLDESMSLKQSYLQRLQKIKKAFSSDGDGGKEGGDRGHTISINAYLGDIHYYDKDYDEAVAYYANASYTTRKKSPKEISRNQLVSLMRNMLKHGLSLERAKAYDTALGIFGELNRIIIEYLTSFESSGTNQNQDNSSIEVEEEKKQFIFTSLKSHFAFLLPYLSQLAIIEKKSPSGITPQDIENTKRVAYKLHFMQELENTDSASHAIIVGLFDVKLANLLYFVNFKEAKSIELVSKELYGKALKALLDYLSKSKKISASPVYDPDHSNIIHFYKNAIADFDNDLDIPSQVLQWTADWLNFYGDTLLSEAEVGSSTYELPTTWLEKITRLILNTKISEGRKGVKSKIKIKFSVADIKRFSNVEKAIFCYLLAVKYNERSQSYRKIVSTLNKILVTTKLNFIVKLEREVSVIASSDQSNIDLLKCLREIVLKQIVKASIRIYDDSLRVNLLEAKILLSSDENELLKLKKFTTPPETFNTIFNTSEVRECLLNLHEIELLAGDISHVDLSLGKSLPNPYNKINSNWARAHSLSHRNNLILKRYFQVGEAKKSVLTNMLSPALGLVGSLNFLSSIKLNNKISHLILCLTAKRVELKAKPESSRVQECIAGLIETEELFKSITTIENQVINAQRKNEIPIGFDWFSEIKFIANDVRQDSSIQPSNNNLIKLCSNLAVIEDIFARIDTWNDKISKGVKTKEITNLIHEWNIIYKYMVDFAISTDLCTEIIASLRIEVATPHCSNSLNKQQDHLHKLNRIEEIISKLSKIVDQESNQLQDDLKLNNEFADKTQSHANPESQKAASGQFPDNLNEQDYCIIEGIFCCSRVLQNLNLFGASYITSHFHFAEAHFKMAFWLQELHFMSHPRENKQDRVKKILVNLGELIGRQDLFNIDQFYHIQQARQHYLSCLQVHERGAYARELMNEMYFLEDDFGDEVAHFSVATDRYLINSGFIHRRLEACKKFTVEHKGEELYNYDAYFLTTQQKGSNSAG